MVTCAALSRADPPVLVTCSDDARHLVWRLGPESPSSAAGPRAEPAPRGPDPPCWGPPTPPPPAPRAARRAPASKRCLLELLDPGTSSKRPRPEPPAYTARSEPLELQAVNEARSEPRPMAAGCKRPRDPSPEPADPCCSFTTPTKDYSRRSYRLSPRTPRRSPSKSPKFTVTLIRTPTKNLPNFVLDGEAPHHRLMSPPKKRHGTTDWLTAIRKKSKTSDGDKTAAPSSPKETTPNRRNSTTEKTPKSNKKSRTLLKYFSVTNKDKC